MKTERSSKRLRSSPCAEADGGFCPPSGHIQETVLSGQKQSGASKVRHPLRLKRQSEKVDQTATVSQLLTASDVIPGDSCSGELLWTDKYSPRRSDEVVGHSASVNKLHSWLKNWKLRAAGDERRDAEERTREEHKFQIYDSWDCGDFQGEAVWDNGGEEPLCKALLLTGPPGIGKTASVYACAQELGFKVFEVNCSSQRSGRLVLSQLKEATQSHLVEASGEDPLKPAYFSSHNPNSCTPKPELVHGKPPPPQRTPFASKRKAVRNCSSSGRRIKAKPSITLAHYFKMKQKADRLHFSAFSQFGKSAVSKEKSNMLQERHQSRTTATSLILFEEVDVIFEDDVGFLAAIKTFMTTTKRPVILTTNDSSFRERFDRSLEEIIFKPPSAVNVCSYLQQVCRAEEVSLAPDDCSSLLRLARGDVRRCLLQLQLWVHSGGGWASKTGGPTGSQQAGGASDPQLPPCQAGCSASMLGLHPVTPKHLLNFLKSQSWPEDDVEDLLAESWRGDVPLLYSNMELLLSLGAAEMTPHRLDNKVDSQLQSEPGRSDTDLHMQKSNRSVGPQVSVPCSKSVRTVSRLSRRRYTVTAKSDLTAKPQKTPVSLRETHPGAPSLGDRCERQLSKAAADCLDALAEFFDLMSCMDTLPDAGRLASGYRLESFVWTGAAVKDGLLDEMSEEDRGSRSLEMLQDFKVAVEGFGFHQCWRRVSRTWTEALKYQQKPEDEERKRLQDKLLLTSSSERQNLSFTARPLRAPGASPRSYNASRMVLSSKPFSLLGNRQAVAVDYMPVLRLFCAQQQKAELGRPGVCNLCDKKRAVSVTLLTNYDVQSCKTCCNCVLSTGGPVDHYRSLNHRSSTHLGLSKSTVRLLAEDFTLKTIWKNI